MNRVVFNIEGRGIGWIYHWYIYMLAGLRKLPDKPIRIHKESTPWFIFEQNVPNDLSILKNLLKPYYITCSDVNIIEPFQQESFDLIKSDFIFIHMNDIKSDDIVISHFGEETDRYFCYKTNRSYFINTEAYDFLRTLFLNNYINSNNHKNKKYFLCRNRSHLLSGNNGIKRRHILNNDEFIEALNRVNIETIFLEDYSTTEKIGIFNEADLIISPNSGALTFTLFGNSNTKIVELNVPSPHQPSDQYSSQCNYFNIPYYFYQTQKEDRLDNMTINCAHFINFLKIQNLI